MFQNFKNFFEFLRNLKEKELASPDLDSLLCPARTLRVVPPLLDGALLLAHAVGERPVVVVRDGAYPRYVQVYEIGILRTPPTHTGS